MEKRVGREKERETCGIRQPQAADPGFVLCHILFCCHSASTWTRRAKGETEGSDILGTSSIHFLRQFGEKQKT